MLSRFELSFSVKLLIDQISAVRHASVVRLNYAEGCSPSSQEYVEITPLFERPTWIELWEIPIEALLAFLGSTRASQLNGWAAYALSTETNNELGAAAEDTIFRSCFDFTNQKPNEPREIRLRRWDLRWDFLLRLIGVRLVSEVGMGFHKSNQYQKMEK